MTELVVLLKLLSAQGTSFGPVASHISTQQSSIHQLLTLVGCRTIPMRFFESVEEIVRMVCQWFSVLTRKQCLCPGFRLHNNLFSVSTCQPVKVSFVN